MDRRRFLRGATSGLAAATLGGAAINPMAAEAEPQQTPAPTGPKKFDKGPPLAPDLVRGFVGAAHGDLEKVKAMLAEQPRLVNATWDWGGGDFETALGGA